MTNMITPGPDKRVHITNPRDWNHAAGTDYWAVFGAESVSADTAGTLLSDFGWTTTSLVETAGSGADFLSSSDVGNPAHLLTNGANDLLQSPAIFGDYIHGQMAADILGYTPSTLNMEFYGAMLTHAVSEVTTTGWGLVEAGGTAGTAADRLVWVGEDTTQFYFSSATDTLASGVTDDAAWHRFKATISNSSATNGVTGYIDGVNVGTMDYQQDLWPASFGMFAGTAERPALAWVHIWYA